MVVRRLWQGCGPHGWNDTLSLSTTTIFLLLIAQAVRAGI